MTRVPAPAVIGGAALVLVLGLVVGFQLLTASADTVETAPTCEDRTIRAGEDLTTALVKVDVFNASRRAGLANRVSINLQRRGFLAGQIGNSQSEVAPDRVAILTDDKSDTRVRLVARQFGSGTVDYVSPDVEISSDAVTVLVGDDFGKLKKKASRSLKADRDITICTPLAALE